MNDNQSNPPVDWSVFRDGDRVRVTFEGTWTSDGQLTGSTPGLVTDRGWMFAVEGVTLPYATSAELIERPWQPPAAGKLFTHLGELFISYGAEGYRRIRSGGSTVLIDHSMCHWGYGSPDFRDSLEVLDV